MGGRFAWHAAWPPYREVVSGALAETWKRVGDTGSTSSATTAQTSLGGHKERVARALDFAGLEPEALYGGFAREPFSDDSREYVFDRPPPEDAIHDVDRPVSPIAKAPWPPRDRQTPREPVARSSTYLTRSGSQVQEPMHASSRVDRGVAAAHRQHSGRHRDRPAKLAARSAPLRRRPRTRIRRSSTIAPEPSPSRPRASPTRTRRRVCWPAGTGRRTSSGSSRPRSRLPRVRPWRRSTSVSPASRTPRARRWRCPTSCATARRSSPNMKSRARI